MLHCDFPWLHSVNRQNAALPEEVKFILFSVFILTLYFSYIKLRFYKLQVVLLVVDAASRCVIT